MTISFNYKITGLVAYPTADEQSDVVFQVNWSCQAVQGYTVANTFGSVPVTYDPSEPYTPYADLTQDQVWGWIDPSINRIQVELDLAEAIIDLQNPVVINPPLPWATP